MSCCVTLSDLGFRPGPHRGGGGFRRGPRPIPPSWNPYFYQNLYYNVLDQLQPQVVYILPEEERVSNEFEEATIKTDDGMGDLGTGASVGVSVAVPGVATLVGGAVLGYVIGSWLCRCAR